MTKYLLEIKAQLQDVSKLVPNGGVNSEEMAYHMELRCSDCGHPTRQQCIYGNEQVQHEREVFHHVMKCRECRRVCTVDLIFGFGEEYTAARGNSYVPLMLFECDGLVPEKYHFNGGWEITVHHTEETIIVDLVNGSYVGTKTKHKDIEVQPIVNKLESKFKVYI